MTARQIIQGVAVEMRPSLALAGPVVAAELGWISMAIVDTLIVGRLGAEAIGAVGLGSTTFFTIVVFGMGLLLGLDALVSQAFGAGDIADCHHSLFQALYLVAIMTPALMLVTLGMAPGLAWLGVEPSVLQATTRYLIPTVWGTGPLLLYAAFRRYLQGMGRVQPVMFALVSANIVNALGNYALVYGHWGLPALGVQGSGWATTISRVYMAGVLIAYTIWHDRKYQTGLKDLAWQPDLARLKRLIGLGLPAALHVTAEVGVFASATALAGRFDAVALAAHQLVLNVSSVTFMIPCGLASAGAVRVGHALGRRDPESASIAGWTTLALATGFMSIAALVFCLLPVPMLRAFTDDPRVIAQGVILFYVAGAFQVFDGVQGVTCGNLRGTGDTHTAMFANLFAHWAVGLPIGYVLAFPLGMGVLGLWIGLATGLILAAVVLIRGWIRASRSLLTGKMVMPQLRKTTSAALAHSELG
jgi:MATE family multidrug resistance protein